MRGVAGAEEGIGRAFGGKHHTTVIHSVEKIESLVATDETLQRLITELSESLQP